MGALDQIVTIANQLVLTERDKDCMRQLIAQEVTLNYNRLCRFFSELLARRHRFAEVAPYLDSIIGDVPTWDHERWDGAPVLVARSMTSDELLSISFWYEELAKVAERYQRLVKQGALLRMSTVNVPTSIVSADSLAKDLEALLVKVGELVDNRRPYVHEAVEKARHAMHADEPVTRLVPEVDPSLPSLYKRHDDQWVRVSAEDLLKEDKDVPREQRYT